MKKRLLALFMSLCLVVGLLPTAAWAEEASEILSSEAENWDDQTGSCVVTVKSGESLETAVKRVIGSDYDAGSVKSLIISTADGVVLSSTEMVEWGEDTPQHGENGATDQRQTTAEFTYMRDYLPNLESVDMSGAAMEGNKIPDNAFRCKTTLKRFVFPDGIQYTGNNSFAFSGLEGTITIPATLLSLSNLAFGYCTSIKNIEFEHGSALTDVNSAFYGCTNLVGDITLPDTVENIGYGAFRNTGITSINMPDALQSMGYYAFAGCTSLTGRFAIPDGITEIPVGLFEGSGVNEVYLPESVTTIGNDAFKSLPPNSKLVFADLDGVNLLSAQKYTAANTNIVADGVTYQYSNGAYTVSTAESDVTSVKILGMIAQIPVTAIAENAFSSCAALTEVDMSQADKIESIGTAAFIGLPQDSVILVANNKVQALFTSENYAAENTEVKLGNPGFVYTWSGSYYAISGYVGEIPELLEIPDSYNGQPVKEIAAGTFAGNTSLKAVSFAAGLQTIGNGAFEGCSALETVTFAADSQLETIGQKAFQETAISNIDLPDSLKKIDQYAFFKCEKLTSIAIPKSVTVIGTFAFAMGTNTQDKNSYGMLSNITFADGIQLTTLGNGAFMNTPVTSVVLPECLKKLPPSLFCGCNKLTSVTLPAGITDIGNQTFSGCPLSSLTLPDGLKTIGVNTFDFAKFETLTIPASVSSLGSGVFSSNTALKTVVFEKDSALTKIVQFAFSGCTALTTIELPDGITAIDNRAFYNCNSLNALYIPAAVTSIGAGGTLYTNKQNFVIYLSEAQQALLNGGTNVSTSNYNSSRTALAILNGGSIASGTDFSGNTLVTTPVKDGYVFSKWYLSTDANKTSVDKAAGGNVYYAEWIESSYDIVDSVSFEDLSYGGTSVSKTITAAAEGIENPSITAVTESDSFAVSFNGMDITITPKDNLSIGTYSETIIITTGDGATHNVLVSLNVVKADSSVTPGEESRAIAATYGDSITFTAKTQRARAESGVALTAALNKVEFFCGTTLLGSAEVSYDESGVGTAVLTYNTSEGGIPVNSEQTITAEYGGSATLNGSKTDSISVTLAPKTLTVTGLAAANRTYDETTTVALTGGELVGVLNGDEVTADMPTTGEMADANVGENKLVTFKDITLSGTDAGNYTLTQPEVFVTITKATYDMSGVKFEDASYTYDGQEKTLVISGTLPESVSVSYENNTLTSAGDVTATAKFTGDSANYNAIPDMTANLTITKAAPIVTITADKETLNGGGDVVLTVITEPEEGTVEISCDQDVDIKLNEEDGTFTATLPNSTQTYTFTAKYVANANYEEASDTCTVEVTYQSSSHGGGGSSRGNSYAVSTPKADNGTVTVNNGSTAKKGDTVTITVKPSEGYEIGTVTVADSKGNSITVTDKGEGKYSFTMPDSKVDVKATFVKAEVEPDQPSKTTFVDVPENSWYADAADFVAQRGLMSGVGENLFGGSQNTTRAMLMTILARMDGQDVTGGSTWYERAMTWAKANGVSDGTMPEKNITREQLATMLYSYAKLKGLDTTQGGMAVREFADYDSISAWAGQSMTWAVNAGILSGRGNNTLAPTAGATRAEMAVMLQQFVKLMEK